MLRVLLTLGLIAVGITLVFFGPRYLGKTSDGNSYSECDLLSGPCAWTTPEGQWQASLTTGQQSSQGQIYRLEIRSPGAPDRFLAVLRGQSMYMGEYPVPLRQQTPSGFSAEFTAPFCTTGGDMVWRVDLQAGQEMLENVPLTLVFKAQK